MGYIESIVYNMDRLSSDLPTEQRDLLILQIDELHEQLCSLIEQHRKSISTYLSLLMDEKSHKFNQCLTRLVNNTAYTISTIEVNASQLFESLGPFYTASALLAVPIFDDIVSISMLNGYLQSKDNVMQAAGCRIAARMHRLPEETQGYLLLLTKSDDISVSILALSALCNFEQHDKLTTALFSNISSISHAEYINSLLAKLRFKFPHLSKPPS